jgi:flagella basal body P-ring formation protein FlgA
MSKRIFITVFCILSVFLSQAQKKYEVLKIEKTELETMNVIYLKKQSADKSIYRIFTRKSDTLIVDKKEISVGDILKLNLVKPKKEMKDGYIGELDKNSFFYSDTYDGKNVNVKYFCPDFIGLYHIEH